MQESLLFLRRKRQQECLWHSACFRVLVTALSALTLLPFLILPSAAQQPVSSKRQVPVRTPRPSTGETVPPPQRASPKRTTPKPTPAVRDASAVRLVVELGRALHALTSLQANVQVARLKRARLTDTVDADILRRLRAQSTLVSQGQLHLGNRGKARLQLVNPADPNQIRYLAVADGQDLWRLYRGEGNQSARCTRHPLGGSLPPRAALSGVLSPLPEEVKAFFVEADPLQKWEKEGRLVQITTGAAGYVEGTQCLFLTIVLRDGGAESVAGIAPQTGSAENLPLRDRTRVTLVIAERDFLPRHIVVERALWGAEGEASIVSFETVQQQEVAETVFQFNLPSDTPVLSAPTGQIPALAGMPLPSNGLRRSPGDIRKGEGRGTIPASSPTLPQRQQQNQPPRPTVPVAASQTNTVPRLPSNSAAVAPRTRSSWEEQRARLEEASAAVTTAKAFGAVNLLDRRYIRESFVVRNTRKETIRLSPPRGSCDCITARYATGDAMPLVKAGEEIRVEVTMDLGVLKPGPVKKFVVVRGGVENAPSEVLGQLALSGELLSAVTVTPALPDLGQWRLEGTKARGKPLVVTASFDPRLLENVSDEEMQMIPAGTASDILLIKPLPVETGDKSNPASIRRYEITLRDGVPIGRINADLRFRVATKNTISENARLVWNASKIVVIGEIRGDIVATPSIVNFGIVRMGGGAKPSTVQTISVEGEASLFEGVSIASTHPAVSARFLPSAETSVSARRSLEVSLILLSSSGIPPNGAISARILVQLANGQRLALPVEATIEMVSGPNATIVQPVKP